MEERVDRFGPALGVLALAGAVFALVAVAAPRLGITGSAQTAAPDAAASVSAAPSGVDQTPEDLPPAAGMATTTTTPEATTFTTTAPQPTTTAPEVTTTTAAPDRAEIELVVVMTTDRDGQETSRFHQGDSITWRFLVTNTGDEYLWGVYVFLEHHGPVPCDSRRLEPGAATVCRIDTVAKEGRHEAEAWATAWTDTRMIAAELFHPFIVLR